MHDADVLIVGAGPAGAIAAHALAAAGARVILIDGSHPREKPCGGGVTGRALALARDALNGHPLPLVTVRHARFVDPGGGIGASVPLGGGSLIVAARRDFDAAIVDAAVGRGARLVRERAIDVASDGRLARVSTRTAAYRAPFLIGADGAGGLTRHRLARPFRREELSIATGFFLHGASSSDILIEMVTDPPGYLWSFPRPTHLAIGICAQADAGVSAAALQARARRWIAERNLGAGRLEGYSWPIPSLTADAFDALAFAGPNWCLAGDAAGLVDPITREGIFYALASGLWAAEAARARDTAVYRRQVQHHAIAELRRAAELKAAFFRPTFSRLFTLALTRSPAIRAVTADLVAGTQPYRSLKWRLLSTFEWRLAWEVVQLSRLSRSRADP